MQNISSKNPNQPAVYHWANWINHIFLISFKDWINKEMKTFLKQPPETFRQINNLLFVGNWRQTDKFKNQYIYIFTKRRQNKKNTRTPKVCPEEGRLFALAGIIQYFASALTPLQKTFLFQPTQTRRTRQDQNQKKKKRKHLCAT